MTSNTEASTPVEPISIDSPLSTAYEHDEKSREAQPQQYANSNLSDDTSGAMRRKTLEDTEARESVSQQVTRVISRIPSATIPPKFSFARELAFIAIVTSAQLLTQAGLAQAIAPLHVIAASLGSTNANQLSWLAAGYSLTVGTFILPAGRWGDLYGHKLLFIIGYVWYAVWSLVAGFSVYSHSLVFFAFCRAMQGIGPALLLPNAIAILTRTYPPGRKASMVISIFGAAAPGGFVIGATFSGIFAQLLWWPWAYWAMGIACACAALLAIFVIPETPVFGGKPKLAELDPVGSILGVTGLVLVNFSWNEGPSVGWQEVYVYVILIIGVLFLAAFLFFEFRRAEYPLLPSVAFSRDTSFVFACMAAGWSSFGIYVFYIWQFLIELRGNSILLTAAQQSPTAISGACAAIITGFIIGRVQPGVIMMASMSAFAVGIALVASMPINETYWAQTFVSTLVITFGMDLSYPSAVIVLSNHMSAEYQGLAASLVNTVVNYSISIGLGFAGTVEAHVNDGGNDLLRGYRGAWYLGIGLDVLGLVLALCLTLSWRATQKARVNGSRNQEHV